MRSAMPLDAGTRLGPYEIIALIGEGGMGAVYQARDTRLNREVAVKTSHAEFNKRFETEARAIAALNHPHICQLYDVGPDYLVMELVDGARLQGPLPVERAVVFAGQILDALDAAHKKGITHRDLKPANILVTKQGIKLLDFGLAKHTAALQESDATLTAALTRQGQIAGTLQYMSPEQLQGRTIDSRSDLFSFGCVLYELLTGKRAFEGDSAASLIAAILERQPAHLAFTAPLERVICRCLAKDPAERWQTARDLKAEMIWEASKPEAAARSPLARWRQWAGWGAAAILAGALIMAWAGRSRPSAAEVVRFTVNPPEKGVFSDLPYTTVAVPQFALSPEGSAIVYATSVEGGKPLLWLRQMADAAAHPLAGTENALLPFWSPDGHWIGFFSEKQLKKIPAGGGAAQTVADNVFDVFGGTWGADDTILFSAATGGISRVPAAGGSPTPVTVLSKQRGDAAHRWPHFLPDGRHFLYYVRTAAENRGIYVGSLGGKTDQFLLKSDASAVYAPPGYLLYVEGDAMLARSFDAKRLEVSGSAFAVQDRLGQSSSSFSPISTSRNGLMAYAAALRHPGRLTWLDRRGVPSGTVGTEAHYNDFRLSPDEARLALSALDAKTSNMDIWITDLRRGNSSRFTFGPILNSSAIWSPDGGRLLYRSNRQWAAVELNEQSADGGGQITPVLSFERAKAAGMRSFAYVPTDWSPDGQTILISAAFPATGYDIWSLPADGQGTPSPLIEGPGDQLQANFSPDGSSVAYASNETGRFEVYFQRLPPGGRKWQVSTGGGTEPRWRRDGREIYYLAPDRKLTAVSVSASGQFGVPQALFQTQVAAQNSVFRTNYLPAANGQRFLLNSQTGDGSATAITVTMNWIGGWKK
jgi:eukaryotic-like serine/threonine-protein kinase